MKRTPGVVAAAGILLLLLGALFTFAGSPGFSERRYNVDAGSCRMALNVVQKSGVSDDASAGSVILFHGLAANKTIMSYLARAFALQGLRVFIPDLPGHGRSTGPFSPAQAETCSISFVRGLAARGLIIPDRTILAGHSMGGAIALRIAPKIRPAGVIAISPAPMRAAYGVTQEKLLYSEPPPLQPNTLILVGRFEPKGLTGNAADLAATRADGSVEFFTVPYNSHVSMLFSTEVARQCQAWAARALHLPNTERLPLRANLVGGILGVIGILLIAGPFLRETFGEKTNDEPFPAGLPSRLRIGLEFTLVSLVVVFLLRYWLPLRPLPLFEGNYLASFFLVAGFLLLFLHPKFAKVQFSLRRGALLAAVFSAFVLHFLLTGWLDLTLTGAWLTLQRWIRFPIFFLAAFVFLCALETLLGPAGTARIGRRFWFSLLLLAIAWLALAAGVLYLHSGQILLILLSPYFAVFFILYRVGAQLVRNVSGSAAAAALFGAILLTGFCLVIFPVS